MGERNRALPLPIQEESTVAGMATKARQQEIEGDAAVLAAQGAATLDNPRAGASAVEKEPIPFVVGESGTKYLFRSKRGVLRDLKYRMDCKEDWWEDPQDDPKSHMSRTNARVFLQAWKRRHDAEEQALLEQAFLDNGSNMVSFVKAPPIYGAEGMEDNTKIEVYYATNSDAIAELIRREIAAQRGDFKFVSEVDQSVHLKVGDRRFANTEVGLKLAGDYMTKAGLSGIELETKAG
jgi:hypothetical protein